MRIQPYLFFDGRCDEAIAFYRETVGAEVTMLMRYKDSPEPHHNPNAKDEHVMHASLRISDSMVMASDGHCLGQPKFEGFALSLSPADEAEANRLFGALSAGGNVIVPLGKTFFSPAFGMLTDRFGVSWMIYVEG